MSDCLYINSDNLVTHNLKDNLDNPITTGTVEGTLRDSQGSEVIGMTWPQALAHQDLGVWTVQLTEALELVEDRVYFLEITANSGTLDGSWKKELIAQFQDGD